MTFCFLIANRMPSGSQWVVRTDASTLHTQAAAATAAAAELYSKATHCEKIDRDNFDDMHSFL